MSHRKSSGMTPEQFRQWRKRLGLKQKEAADQLGLKKRVIQYYEKGTRDGKKVEIPKTVRLACYALASGIGDFDGEATESADISPETANGFSKAGQPSLPEADAEDAEKRADRPSTAGE